MNINTTQINDTDISTSFPGNEVNPLLTCAWEKKFAFLPKKCRITNKIIWLKYAYRSSEVFLLREFTVDVKDSSLKYYWMYAPTRVWHECNSHLIWSLKK